MQTEPSKTDPPKRKRRWLQFSLRTLLLTTFVIAATTGWLGKRIEDKHRERDEVAAIVKGGGRVAYDYEKNGTSRGPSWLRSVLGEDFFGTVVEADLSGTAVTDDGLAALASLANLETLDISDTRVTDAGLLHAARLRNLKSLRARNSSTTWAAHHRTSDGYILSTVFVIQGFQGTSVTRDDATYQPRITDAGLEHFGMLTNLESLDLEGTDVTSTGIATLCALSHLKYLNVRGTNVSEAAIADLKRAIPPLQVDKYFSPTVSSEQIGGGIIAPQVNGALIDYETPTRSTPNSSKFH
jgi:Leucine Rich repeat